MNPALPLVALLGAAGFLLGAASRRRFARELGTAWAVLAFAGIALLQPALALPTGIPSPAASLGENAPWQAASAAPAGNPVLRDVTYQIEPWLLYLRHELRAGRLPFWNPHQFSGTPFWANGQSAPLFPLHLLFAALPLGIGFVLLAWLRFAIAGCGAFALARELGLRARAALVAALIFPLSGMLVSFLLFPMGNALCLVPWVLWAVERSASGARYGTVLLASTGGLQLLAGHPETALYTALLSALYLLVRGGSGGLRAWARLAAGWTLAAAVAAVEILPVALTLPEIERWRLALAATEPAFSVLLLQPLRLVLPQLYGHPVDGTWWGPFNYSATAVYASALALPLAAAGLWAKRADRRFWAVAALLAFAFVAAYHWPGVRDVLRALPLVGRAAPHRLLFAVELALALLAGAGCDAWLAGHGRGLLVGGAVVVLLLAVAFVVYGGDLAVRDLAAAQARWGAAVAISVVLLALTLLAGPRLRGALALFLPAVILCDLLAAHRAINPGLPLERLYPAPAGGAVAFLRGQEGRAAAPGETLRPNAAMAYGLDDVRGDDPVKLARYEKIYGGFAVPDPVYFQPIRDWRSPWLDLLGVRWVMTGPNEAAPVPGWRLAHAGADARVFERPGALARVRWDGTDGQVTVALREPGFWRLAWSAARRGRVVVTESW
ncbi:MAG TPA: YfhO family protein, partial [Thermoanaerobaculia bacterium]